MHTKTKEDLIAQARDLERRAAACGASEVSDDAKALIYSLEVPALRRELHVLQDEADKLTEAKP